jgi:hypothetical protein
MQVGQKQDQVEISNKEKVATVEHHRQVDMGACALSNMGELNNLQAKAPARHHLALRRRQAGVVEVVAIQGVGAEEDDLRGTNYENKLSSVYQCIVFLRRNAYPERLLYCLDVSVGNDVVGERVSGARIRTQ